MNQTKIVKLIVKAYFFGALAVSFLHIVGAAHKLDLTGWQAWTTPAGIDGIAIIGLIMRSDRWSTDTRKLGLRVQITAGVLSLACNVFAGNTLGERIYGVMIVALFVFSEWLSDHMQTREAEVARSIEQAAAAKKAAAIAKGQATRKANREATERMVTSGKRKMNRELKGALATA